MLQVRLSLEVRVALPSSWNALLRVGGSRQMRVEDEHPALLTVQDVANRLRVHPSTVRRWIQQRDLEAVLLPHRGTRQAYRIRPAALERLLLAHEQRSTQPQSFATKEESL